ncbi:hypothetical protein Psfp_04148 [Pelotomaculum sp. FP]|uniref:hypothetical protein n=1 Tax=Pelotomaculum sp. FP TaxID=261474 RepID=UPI001064723D|nr:hypothetical protein [Pelotomaculum sp. FP]TEB10610.1 hypothetical protein Psfp_04148 [Pelotomaculum sp. FP]
MTDPYEKFAYDYDEFGDISDYLGDEKNFCEAIFKKYNVKSVLDCACGTGQHLYMMNKLGMVVEGSDLYHSVKRTESNQYDICNKILLDDDYKNLLADAGFSKIHIYGDYEMHNYDKDSNWRIIIIAEK